MNGLTVTLTYTHPVFGTVTREYDVVNRQDEALIVVRDGESLATLTHAEINAMNGVWATPAPLTERFFGIFK